MFPVRMLIAPVAGDAGYCGDRFPLFIFVKAEIFLVDLRGHLHHVPGNIFFGFRIAGKIQVVRSRVGRWRMAEIALHPQGFLEPIHHFVKVLMADVFWKDLQVLVRVLVWWRGGGDPDNNKSNESKRSRKFFDMVHNDAKGVLKI